MIIRLWGVLLDVGTMCYYKFAYQSKSCYFCIGIGWVNPFNEFYKVINQCCCAQICRTVSTLAACIEIDEN